MPPAPQSTTSTPGTPAAEQHRPRRNEKTPSAGSARSASLNSSAGGGKRRPGDGSKGSSSPSPHIPTGAIVGATAITAGMAGVLAESDESSNLPRLSLASGPASSDETLFASRVPSNPASDVASFQEGMSTPSSPMDSSKSPPNFKTNAWSNGTHQHHPHMFGPGIVSTASHDSAHDSAPSPLSAIIAAAAVGTVAVIAAITSAWIFHKRPPN